MTTVQVTPINQVVEVSEGIIEIINVGTQGPQGPAGVPAGSTGDFQTNNGAGSFAAVAVVPINRGGTGQTTANAGLNALVPSQTGNNGLYLKTDGTNTSWATAGVGTVTSVGLTLPGIFSVAGSPVTTSGTLTGTLATQNANIVFAGPTTGAAAAPTFRSLVAADLPAGTGTVTSVGLSLPGIFSVSGSPVTTSGTLTGSLATQTANLVWAGPSTGAAAAPTFRSLVAADIPTLVGGSSGQVQYNNSGAFDGMASTTVATSGTLLTITAQAATDKPLVIKGAASQSADLQQWQNSSGVTVFSVSSTGTWTLGPTTNPQVTVKVGDFNGELAITNGQGGYFNSNNKAIQMPSNGQFVWSTNTTNTGASSYDTGLSRSSAGVVTVTNGSSGSGSLLLNAASASTVPLTAKGAASQSADLQQWQDSSANVLVSVTKAGVLKVQDGTPFSVPSISFSGGAGIFTSSGPSFVVGTTATGYFAANAVAFTVPSNSTIGWSSGAIYANGPDTGLKRAASKVVGITNSSTAGGTLSSIPLSPAAIAADQNDYNPGVGRRYRLTTDGSGAKNITGLSISQVDGQEFSIVNIGTDNIVLKHQSASSTAANRFICTGAADVTLSTDQEALGWYDNTTARFRLRKV